MNSAPYDIVICALSLWFYFIFFQIFSQKHDFRKNALNMKCVFFLYTYCLKHLSLYEEFSEMFFINLHRPSPKSLSSNINKT